ncbi:peptidoglycan-binding domain-containing protein [Paracidovorax citrulli]
MGAPDGGMGPKTANGLRAFQKDKGLPVTGRLDAATTDALSR